MSDGASITAVSTPHALVGEISVLVDLRVHEERDAISGCICLPPQPSESPTSGHRNIATAVLTVVTVLMHYEVLNVVGAMKNRFSLLPRIELLLLIAAAFVAHVVNITLYAAAEAWIYQQGAGGLVGDFSGSPADFFYFSAASYTTLGFGDIYATGAMRVIAGLEGLNGLVLITWSASFAYASTSSLWDRSRS